MRLDYRLNELLNMQITHELRNANIYRQIQSYFENLQLKNLAIYFKKQADHETKHAEIIIDYLNSRTGGNVSITEIKAPNIVLNDMLDVSNIYVSTEESTTESIEEIMALVVELKSFMDMSVILDLLKEQVEEEDSANEFCTKLLSTKDLVLFDSLFSE